MFELAPRVVGRNAEAVYSCAVAPLFFKEEGSACFIQLPETNPAFMINPYLQAAVCKGGGLARGFFYVGEVFSPRIGCIYIIDLNRTSWGVAGQ